MDIEGLKLFQISRRMEKYVADYFKGDSLPESECLFAESCRLHYGEVEHLIPKQYHHLFNAADWFTGVSGFIEPNSEFPEDEGHVIMLLMDEDSSKAYFLFLQTKDKEGEEKNIILQDFLCS